MTVTWMYCYLTWSCKDTLHIWSCKDILYRLTADIPQALQVNAPDHPLMVDMNWLVGRTWSWFVLVC